MPVCASGTGGLVDLQIIKPHAAKKDLTLGASFEQNGQQSDNPDFSNKRDRFAGSSSDRFADGSLGTILTGTRPLQA